MTALRQLEYSPAVFNVGDIGAAKRIILTKEGNLTTEERWRKETPYLLSLIEQSVPLNENSIVLDYGCGIGRIAGALIARFGCRVIGADISVSMRALAASYVGSDRFFVVAPEALAWLGISFDAAISVWCLQHCHQVEHDVARIHAALKPGGQLFIVNDKTRIVPTTQGWASDGKDLRGILAGQFRTQQEGSLDPAYVGELIARASYWATWGAA